MWHNTRVTEMIGIEYPIMQGPFGGNFSLLILLQQFPMLVDSEDMVPTL
jgi:NAD(P)H-dependent flavin oxidoreductase YrpB (nitropropane dioxygenase family)